MDFISGFALVLLTLVAYSSGAVLAGRGKRVTPRLLDLAVVVALWAVALTTQAALGKGLAILVWLVIGLTMGTAMTGLYRGRYPDRKQKVSATAHSGGGLRRLWERWNFRTGKSEGLSNETPAFWIIHNAGR